MKNINLITTTAFLAASIFMSPAILAEYSSSMRLGGHQNDNGYMTLEQKKELVRSCGHYDEIGPSSIFGMPNEYQERFPQLGSLSAEIDRVAKIYPGTRKTVQTTFRDAKDKWERLDYSLEKNKRMLRRNEVEVNTTIGIKDKTMKFFESSQSKLAEEQRFVLSKALKEVTSSMKSDAPRSLMDQQLPSSWDHLNICRNWWEYEQKSVPQWQKNNPGNNGLSEIKGNNYGYGVERQFGDGKSTINNATNKAGSRNSDRSSNYTNKGIERFEYDYRSSKSRTSTNAGNGGLEMQW